MKTERDWERGRERERYRERERERGFLTWKSMIAIEERMKLSQAHRVTYKR